MKIDAKQIDFFTKARETLKKGLIPNGEKAISYYLEIFAEELRNKDVRYRGNLNPKCSSCIRYAVNTVYDKVKEITDKIIETDNEQKDNTDKGDKGENQAESKVS